MIAKLGRNMLRPYKRSAIAEIALTWCYFCEQQESSVLAGCTYCCFASTR